MCLSYKIEFYYTSGGYKFIKKMVVVIKIYALNYEAKIYISRR